MTTEVQIITNEYGDNFDSNITAADYKPQETIEELCARIYGSRIVTAMCELCGVAETDTPEHLEQGGWLLLNHDEFCGSCRW